MNIFTAIIGIVCLQTLFLASTYVCTHQWKSFIVAVLIISACGIGLYFTWYKHLPDKDENVQYEKVA